MIYGMRNLLVLFWLLVTSSSLIVAHADEPSKVTVGAYINDIQAIDLREHSYAVDIYIWFRWQDRQLSPHESVEMVNPNELWGHVSRALYDQPVEMSSGELYQVIRVQGRFSRKFFFDNFPFDRQELVVVLEDSTAETNRLRYQADDSAIQFNPELRLPGFRVFEPKIKIEDFCYPTSFGDTRRSEPGCYSRVTLSVPIRRPMLASSIKLLLPVFCVVFGASLMLQLRVTYVDARLGVGITALLTVVAIQLASNDTMPNVDYLVLMDKVHLCAYGYVLAGLAVVLATIGLTDRGQVDMAIRLQSRGLFVISALFLAIVASLIAIAIRTG
jgi:hypothetical protein